MMKTVIFTLLCTMSMLFSSWKDNSLKDITKPYLGEYECQTATLGTTDYTAYFQDIRLELKSDETFLLHYCEKGGKKRTEQGKYTYDRKKGTVTLQGGAGGFLKREFVWFASTISPRYIIVVVSQ